VLGVPSGKALGMRCAVASDYLRERFDLPDERGCVVLRVSGPAERAGIRQGDLMIGMDGVPIVSGAQFSILFENSNRDRFEFEMVRSGQAQPLTLHVKMGPTKGPNEDRTDPFFYYLRARSDTEREHIQRDIQDYTRAIDLAPGFDIAYKYRGELYQELGELEAARADYARAIELSPDLGVAHRWLATLDQEEGDTDSALRGFGRAIALDMCERDFTRYNIECAEAYLLLAGFYMGTDIEKVQPAAERSIEFYPGFAEPYYQLAVAHYFLDEDQEAERYAKSYHAFPERDVEPEKVAALEALLEESSFNCDGELEDAPRWHCPIPVETSPP
jgi:tetratricopeptide (TPR) repeat protein